MNLNQLAKEICKREGLKKQVNIAQVKEILRVIVDMVVDSAKWDSSHKYWDISDDSPLCSFEDAVHKKLKKKAKKK